MKITCLQMDMALGRVEENFALAEAMIRQAVEEKPDVIVLPETWNTGFFPENVRELADRDGAQTKEAIGALAKEFAVNIVAGSVANVRDGKLYNTAFVFDREGKCVAEYDKTHLFSPMGEDAVFAPGDRLCRFALDGVRCGIIICYDLRFPELTRSLAVQGLDVLFVVSQWPDVRISHLQSLAVARAIENQIFLVCCNSCGKAGDAQYGGSSAMIDPWGRTIAQAGNTKKVLTEELDMNILEDIGKSICVFRDRRPELYRLCAFRTR